MNRKVRLRRLLLTTATLLLALGSLGVAYAAWTSNLSIGVTVQTATMSVEWLTTPSPTCTDSVNAQVSRDATDDALMHFTVSNAYPGYTVTCYFSWENNGTIPVEITSLDVNGTPVTSGVATNFDLAGDSAPDLEITLRDGVNSAYAPGAGDTKSLTVTVLSGAPEGTDITFTGHVNFVQATGS